MLSCSRGSGGAVAGDIAGRARARGPERLRQENERLRRELERTEREARSRSSASATGSARSATGSRRSWRRRAGRRSGRRRRSRRDAPSPCPRRPGRKPGAPTARARGARPPTTSTRSSRCCHRRRARRAAAGGGDRAGRRPVPSRSPAGAATRDRLPRPRRPVSALWAPRPRARRAPDLDRDGGGGLPGGAGARVGGVVAHRAAACLSRRWRRSCGRGSA